MPLDDPAFWVSTFVGGFAGGSLFVNMFHFIKYRKAEELHLTESVMKDIRDLEGKRDSEQDKIEWGRNFFNTIEWFSFLINKNHIRDKKVIEFFKSAMHMWHKDYFNDETYIDKKTRENKEDYEEFRELHTRFRLEENWKDCTCCDCKND